MDGKEENWASRCNLEFLFSELPQNTDFSLQLSFLLHSRGEILELVLPTEHLSIFLPKRQAGFLCPSSL